MTSHILELPLQPHGPFERKATTRSFATRGGEPLRYHARLGIGVPIDVASEPWPARVGGTHPRAVRRPEDIERSNPTSVVVCLPRGDPASSPREPGDHGASAGWTDVTTN